MFCLLSVTGDFNAKIGYPKQDRNLIMGKYGYGERNERGEKLIQFAYEHKLSIMNTYFNKKPQRKWTWISPDEKTKNEIDFILCNNIALISNVEVLNQLSYPSDHRLVRASINLNIPKSRKNYKCTLKSLKTEKDIATYLRNLERNFKQLNLLEQQTENVDLYYNTILETIKKSLDYEKQDININKSKKQNQILSENTKTLIKKRKQLIEIRHKTKEIKREITKIYKLTNKSIRHDYNAHRQQIIEKNLTMFRSTKRAKKELLTHKDWIQNLHNNHKKTQSRKEVLECATAYYRELYKKQDVELSEENKTKDLSLMMDVPPFTTDEIQQHLNKLKIDKSPGPDNISNEALKIGAHILLTPLTWLFNIILNQKTVPGQWCTSDIILLYKKGDPLDIGN